MKLVYDLFKSIFGFMFSLAAQFITFLGGSALSLSQETIVGIALILMIIWIIYLIRNYEMETSAKFGHIVGSVGGFLGLIGGFS